MTKNTKKTVSSECGDKLHGACPDQLTKCECDCHTDGTAIMARLGYVQSFLDDQDDDHAETMNGYAQIVGDAIKFIDSKQSAFTKKKYTSKDEWAVRAAERALDKIKKYTKDGLPDCYKDVHEWLYDFYPDLPWDNSSIISLKWFLTDKGSLAALEEFSKRFEFDMKAELEKGLKHAEEEASPAKR